MSNGKGRWSVCWMHGVWRAGTVKKRCMLGEKIVMLGSFSQ